MRLYSRIAFVLLALALIPLPGCRRAANPDETEAPTEPKPPEGPLALQFEPATLQLPQGGKGKLKVTVMRGNYRGELTLEMRNLPKDVTAARITLPAGETNGQIELSASATANGSERADTNILAAATSGARKQLISGNIKVSVQGPPFALEASPSVVKIPQRGKGRLKVTAARKGYQGPIAVELQGAPANLAVPKAIIPKGQDSVELELAATGQTPAADRDDVQVRGVASDAGNTFRALSPAFKISVQAAPFSLEVTPKTVVLPQGGKVLLTINAPRKEYRDAIRVELRNLPEGITASKVSIPGFSSKAEVELVASPQALAAGKKSIQVVGTAGGDFAFAAVAEFALQIQPALQLQVQPRPLQVAQGGKVLVRITPIRHNYDGPLTLELRGLPPGVTGPATATLAASKRFEEMVLSAADDAPLGAKGKAQVVARAFGTSDKQLAVADLNLAVLEVGAIPTGPFGLKVQPHVLKLSPGNKATLKVLAIRKEHQGPITLELRNLPPHVTAGKVTIAEKQLMANLEVTAAPEAVIGDKADVNVLGSASPGLQIASPNLTVSVQPRPFELRTSPGSLRVTIGGTAALKVQATRKSYDGPIAVELRNLPAKVSASKATIPAGHNEVEIEVSVPDNAEPATKNDTHVFGIATTDQQQVMATMSVAVVPGLCELRIEPAVIKISHGGKTKVRVVASRKGFWGPIPVELRGLPKPVTATKATIGKGEAVAEIELKAAFEATEGDVVDVHARTVVGLPAKVINSPCVTLSVVSVGQAAPFEVKAEPAAFKLHAGQDAKLKVTVVRKPGFTGPVELEVRNLPADVTAAKVTVPMKQSSAVLQLISTAVTAAASRTDVCVVGTGVLANGQSQSQASAHLTLTVLKK